MFSSVISRALIPAAILACAVFATAPAYATDLDDLRAEAAEVQAQIDEAQEKLDAASRDYDDAKTREQDARKAADDAKKAQDDIAKELEEIGERIGERAVYQYKTDSIAILDMILSIDSFEKAEQVFAMFDRMNAKDQADIDSKHQLTEQLVLEEEKALAAEEDAQAQKELAAGIKEEAQADIDELEEIYDGISDEVASILYAQQMAASYQYSAAYPSGGGTNWSGVKAPADANDIVARAYAALGSPYAWGGVGNGGYDCSGLVSYCVSGEHARIGTTSTFMGYEQTSDPQPGDIVTNSGHCGIYIGDGQMIHASDYGTGVIIGPVQSGMIAVKS